MTKLSVSEDTKKKFLDNLFDYMEDIFPSLLLAQCNCVLNEFSVSEDIATVRFYWVPAKGAVEGVYSFNLHGMPYSTSGIIDRAERVLEIINRSVVNGMYLSDKQKEFVDV